MTQPSWIGYLIGGRYKIEALLGQGGMSAVYRATDPNLRRIVAVKLIHAHLSGDPEFVRRFEEEAAAVAQLKHPNIVQVYDFNHDGDTYYMVLEYVPGETLQAKLKALSAAKQRLSLAETIRIATTICEAVDYAHQRGLIHRDLKPANVMLDLHGQPILMDFGLAKILGGQYHTVTGSVIGTPLYMSPEQVRGERLDIRTDIYSLGVMLFEMTTGRPPFEADSAMSIMLKHLNEPVPDIRQINRAVPDGLVSVIEKALAKLPVDRFQSVSEIASALRSIDTRPESIRPEVTAKPQDRVPAVTPNLDRPVPASPTVVPEPAAVQSTARSERPVSQEPLSVPAAAAVDLGARPMEPAAPATKRGVPKPLLIGLPVAGLILIGLVLGVFRQPSADQRVAGPVSPTVATSGPVAGNVTSAPATATAPVPSVTPAPTSSPTVEPTATEIPVPAGMVLVPGGTFNMGSDKGAADEAPIHPVTLDAFWIDQYEATNARYKQCVDAGVCSPPAVAGSFTRSSYFNNPKFADFPVSSVSWNQAEAFCKWDQGKRLPTEAEWEYAAKGGDDRRYPWGNDFDPNRLPAAQPDTTAVGSYKDGASPFGVYDMAGNVVEWVADWYSPTYYSRSEAKNPTGPPTGDRRVLRGGAFDNPDGSFYTTTARYKQPPGKRDVDIGFRCASSIPAQ